MKKASFFTLLVLLTCCSSNQNKKDKDEKVSNANNNLLDTSEKIIKGGLGINNIKINYSTFDDVRKNFGEQYDSTHNSSYPIEYGDDKSFEGVPRYDELTYKNLGIKFVGSDQNNVVGSIIFSPPFKGKTANGINIELGVTTFQDVFDNKNLDSLNVSTTGSSWYFSLDLDSLRYYVPKDTTGSYLNKNYLGVYYQPFNKSLTFLKKQKIQYIEIREYFDK